MLDDGHAIGETRQHVQRFNTEPSAHAVRCFFIIISTPLLTDDLFNIGYVSVFYRRTCESILTLCEYDRQFSESCSPAPDLFLDEDLSLTNGTVPYSPTPGPSLVLGSGKQALELLVSCPIPEGKLASLIEATFSSERVSDIVGCLTGNDAQTFIDVVDEVCHCISSTKNGLVDPFKFLRSNRHWKASASHHVSGRNV